MSAIVQLLVGLALSATSWMIRNPTTTNVVGCAAIAGIAAALLW